MLKGESCRNYCFASLRSVTAQVPCQAGKPGSRRSDRPDVARTVLAENTAVRPKDTGARERDGAAGPDRGTVARQEQGFLQPDQSTSHVGKLARGLRIAERPMEKA